VRGSLIIGDNCAVQGGTAWREVSVDSQAGPRFLFPGAGAFLASPLRMRMRCVRACVCVTGARPISLDPLSDLVMTQKQPKRKKSAVSRAPHWQSTGGVGEGGKYEERHGRRQQVHRVCVLQAGWLAVIYHPIRDSWLAGIGLRITPVVACGPHEDWTGTWPGVLSCKVRVSVLPL
jgi:hypothetical protein